MKLEIDMPEHHYNNIIAFDSVSLGRVPYKGIIMYAINAIKHGKVLEQEPKTGHWKAFIHNAYHGTDEDGEPIWREVTVYHCSQCNRRTVIKEKFCPNCGAKMVEPQEREGKE